jgi:hypothetical protein
MLFTIPKIVNMQRKLGIRTLTGLICNDRGVIIQSILLAFLPKSKSIDNKVYR